MHRADPELTSAVETQVGQVPRSPEAFHERERAYIAELERVLRQRPDVRAGNRMLMAQLLFEVAETASAWLAHGRSSSFPADEALAEATEAICRYIEASP